jgi:hypothetical protein
VAEVGDEDPEVGGEAEQAGCCRYLQEFVVGLVYDLSVGEEGSEVFAFVTLEGTGEVVRAVAFVLSAGIRAPRLSGGVREECFHISCLPGCGLGNFLQSQIQA